MADNRPPIPRDIQRQVRQRCKFCCVICKELLCDIDHIVEYSVVREHLVDNLVLLCPNHHSKKTKKRINRNYVRQKLQERLAEPESIIATDEILVKPYSLKVGNNEIRGFSPNEHSITLLVLNQVKLNIRHLINGSFLVGGTIKDFQGNILVEIEENQIMTSTHIWDIEARGKTIIFREAPRKKILELEIDGENSFITVKGSFDIGLKKKLNFKNDGIKLGKHLLASGTLIDSCESGIIIRQFDTLLKAPNKTKPGAIFTNNVIANASITKIDIHNGST